MSGYAWPWRYLSILLLRHHPIRLMALLSTPDQRKARSPAVRRERLDMSLTSNPRFGPQKPTMVLRVFEIMIEVMFPHLPAVFMMQGSGVEGGPPWALRGSTRWRRAVLGHKSGSPDAFFPIYPTLTTFFWTVNISVKNLRLVGCLQWLWLQRRRGCN